MLAARGDGLGATTLETRPRGSAVVAVTPAVGVVARRCHLFLVNTVRNVGAPNKTASSTHRVGFTLVFCILMGGPLTGASLNPARTLGPAIAADIYDDLWVYFAGPALGAVAAAALWRYFLRNKPRRSH